MQPTRCPDLPPDLLREISCRIHDVADFVRFHAVSKPWRESHELSTRKTTTDDHFMPWLLAPNRNMDDSLKFRCVFSKCSYRAPPPTSGTGKNWVTSADGTAVRYFSVGPTLTDPLTGDVTHLPLFPDGQWDEENPSGITYDDGTVLLYRNYKNIYGETDEFRVALLRPGDDEWTLIHRTLESPYVGELCVAYHAGKILATVERKVWQVVTLTTTPSNDVLILTPPSMPLKHDGYFYQHGHVFECCGKLLWATVHIRWDYGQVYEKASSDLSHVLLVSVHSLEEARWVPKKGVSLANLVLFLGWPNSFSVDASRLGIKGGFVYFMHFCIRTGVYTYSLMDNTTEFIDWLPQGWGREMCTWLLPQPTIAPIHLGRATTPRSNKMIRTERHCSPLSS